MVVVGPSTSSWRRCATTTTMRVSLVPQEAPGNELPLCRTKIPTRTTRATTHGGHSSSAANQAEEQLGEHDDDDGSNTGFFAGGPGNEHEPVVEEDGENDEDELDGETDEYEWDEVEDEYDEDGDYIKRRRTSRRPARADVPSTSICVIPAPTILWHCPVESEAPTRGCNAWRWV